MRPRRILAAALLLAGVPAAAQPDDPSRVRARAVSGWLVEELSESDGGRIVRLVRTRPGYRLDYQAVFWRGNYGPIRGFTLADGACRSGDAGAPMPPDWVESEAAVSARFGAYLAECGIRGRRAARRLAGLRPAFALFAAWVAEADAAIAAENRAIADHGAQPDERPAPAPER